MGSPDICVFAPSLSVTVSIEPCSKEFDELHFHPRGQGFWIARMIHNLGLRPIVVAPIGGESGRVLEGLCPAWKVDLCSVVIGDSSPVYLQDRRNGERCELAHSRPPTLDRHEVDDLYNRVLELAISTGACVVTGTFPSGRLPQEFFERLGADLAATQVQVTADLHGEELSALSRHGKVHTLKVSDEDLELDDLLAPGAAFDDRWPLLDRQQGTERMVISSARHPTVARFRDKKFRAQGPVLQAADPRGCGDAMTAALSVAMLKGLDPVQTLQLSCAAGAANVTRRGLGNADLKLVQSLLDRVDIQMAQASAFA